MSLSALRLFTSGSAPNTPKNAAIARCYEVWKRRYDLGISKGESDIFAAHAADDFYCEAMHALTDYGGIRDFITCAAQVALGDLRRLPQPARPPGRPKMLTE